MPVSLAGVPMNATPITIGSTGETINSTACELASDGSSFPRDLVGAPGDLRLRVPGACLDNIVSSGRRGPSIQRRLPSTCSRRRLRRVQRFPDHPVVYTGTSYVVAWWSVASPFATLKATHVSSAGVPDAAPVNVTASAGAEMTYDATSGQIFLVFAGYVLKWNMDGSSRPSSAIGVELSGRDRRQHSVGTRRRVVLGGAGMAGGLDRLPHR